MSQFAFAEPERDPRAFEGMENLDVLRRRELWDLAERIGVPYPEGATAEKMREILRGVPHIVDAVNQVKANPESGRPVTEQVVEKFHSSDDIAHGKRAENQDDMDLKTRTPFELKKVCKDRGLKMPKTATKKQMLAALGVE